MNKNFLALCALSVLVIAAYHLSLQNSFSFDDNVHLVENTAVRCEGFQSFKDIFTTATFPGDLYRPLVYASYFLTDCFFSLNPFWYHLENLIIHFFVVGFLFLLILPFGQQIAFFAAGIFAVHPVNVEAVANVTGRAELFVALFGLAYIYFFHHYIKSSKLVYLCLGILAYILALISKEHAVVLIILCPLYLFFQTKQFKKLFYLSILSTIVLAGYLLFRAIILGSDFVGIENIVSNPLAADVFSLRVLKAILLQGKYLLLYVWPKTLLVDYSCRTLDSLFILGSRDFFLCLSVFLLFVVTTVTAIAMRSKILSFCCLWYILAFLITSNIFLPIGTIFAERLLYLPGMGLAVLAASLLSIVGVGVLRKAIFLCVVIGLILKSHLQVGYWKDDYTLFSNIVRNNEYNCLAYYNLGILERDRGNLDMAEEHLKKSLDLFFPYYKADLGLATIAQRRGDLDSLRTHLGNAYAKNSTDLSTLNMLGHLELIEGNLDQARKYFKQAQLLKPVVDYHTLMGLYALADRIGDVEARAKYLTQLIELYGSQPKVKILKQQSEKLS